MIKKVLFLCTANSARSQIAEAIVNAKGNSEFIAFSAGSRPSESIDPFAFKVMEELGVDLNGYKPKSLQTFVNEEFDFIITLCDKMKNECPSLLNDAISVHWGMPDPRDFNGSEEEKLIYFKKIRNQLVTRINLLFSIPIDKLEQSVVRQKLNEAIFPDDNATYFDK